MKRLRRFASVLGSVALVTVATVTATGNVSASPYAKAILGYTYVNDNTAGSNSIAAFARHADGTLTAVAGSPFATGGAGTGTIIGSQGAIQVTSDNRYLLAVNAGSSQISVLRIQADGSLRLVNGGVVSSDGVTPVSIAIHDGLVYVANSGSQYSNYTGFALNPGGHLRPIDGSTVWLPDGTVIGDVLFNGDGTRLVGTRVGTDALSSEIDSFAVSAGLLVAAPGSPFAAQAAGPFGSEFRPTDSSQLFVSNAHAGANNGTVSAYSVSSDGTLTSIWGSPYPDHQTAPCWVEISPDGQFLYAVNTAVPSISSYAIKADGSLTLLGSTPFQHPSGLRPFDARLDPSGHFLYVVDAGAAAVSVFSVSGGTLTEMPDSPVSLPTGATPFGIATT